MNLFTNKFSDKKNFQLDLAYIKDTHMLHNISLQWDLDWLNTKFRESKLRFYPFKINKNVRDSVRRKRYDKYSTFSIYKFNRVAEDSDAKE